MAGFAWPGGARLALSLVLNVEEWSSGMPSIFAIPFPPGAIAESDSVTVTDREYGYRAGLPRLLDILSSHEVLATAVVSGLAAELHPEVIRELEARGHEVAGHGYDQCRYSVVLDRAGEEENIRMTREAIVKATGKAPVGWLSPGARSTIWTADLLALNGFQWHGDTLGDDLPRVITAAGMPMVEIPYSLINNDFRFYMYGNPPYTPREANECLIYELDILYKEGAEEPKMMTYGIHPFVTGRPGRAQALDEFLRYAISRPGIWFARRDEIARWCLEHHRAR